MKFPFAPIALAVVVMLLTIPDVGRSQPGLVDDKSEAPEGKEFKLKRRSDLSDEDLRKQLLLVPELGLDQPTAAMMYNPINKAIAKDLKAIAPDFGPAFLNQAALSLRRPDLIALPWRVGVDSQIGKEAAEELHVLSVELRRLLRASVPSKDVRPDPEKLRELLEKSKAGESGIKPSEWLKAEAIPTLTQMLQAEGTPVRLFLVELLSEIKGNKGTAALAQRALFDLSPKVREKAVQALSQRPTAEVRPFLVEGLRWPWPAAADHAAEAIVALQMKEVVPDLIHALKDQDPSFPFIVEDKGKSVQVVRELVRINHLCNCMTCHAPSLSKGDLVRGRVPTPGEDPPPAYYADTTGLFVRAEITFLRQDFSVVQPVAVPGKWPGNQRYDYLLRIRRASPQEVKLFAKFQKEKKIPESYPQKEARLFALRELTAMDLGNSYEDWAPLLMKKEKKSAASP